MSEACPYCDGPMSHYTRDHIIPKIMGQYGAQNIIKVCRSCNQLKGSMTPDALRALAADMRVQADRIDCIAWRVEKLKHQRGLS